MDRGIVDIQDIVDVQDTIHIRGYRGQGQGTGTGDKRARPDQIAERCTIYTGRLENEFFGLQISQGILNKNGFQKYF